MAKPLSEVAFTSAGDAVMKLSRLATTVGCLSRRSMLLAGLAAAAPFARAELQRDDDPDASPKWKALRDVLFKGRAIESQAAEVIELETPRRAEDAAVVPVAVRAKFPQGPERSIQRIWLIVDNNPSPLSATLQYTLASGLAAIETRVRIQEYSFVRAVAETSDGRLWMAANFVKASGGCSAPPGKDPQAALASLGKTKLRIERQATSAAPAMAQLMVSHPNDSGMVMDQVTRQYAPAYFVRKVDVSYRGQAVLSADLDFSISENPNLRFCFMSNGEGELRAEIVDSHDLEFTAAVKAGVSA